MFENEYLNRVYQSTAERNKGEVEFLQSVREIFQTLSPVVSSDPRLERYGILERLVEPDRQIMFRVAWEGDDGRVHVNRGYRVQFNNAIGPYKGGLRLHPTVNASVVKFLSFEQVFKNSLTTLPMGGAKGGSDFNPKGKSDKEVMRFCQSFMMELSRHIGQFTDIPAGDIGVGPREVGYMFGQYKRISGEFTGVLTGKGLAFGGSLVRTEATGYGLCYYVDEVLRLLRDDSFEDKTVVISGSGNVAIYAAEKATQLGGKVVALSDSSGYIYDENGVDLDLVKEIKQKRNARIADYVQERQARYHEGGSIWEVPCDVALPCATQNELDEHAATTLVKNGCTVVAEGANMPCTPEAIQVFMANKVLYGPGKAANAGGVATSGLEMSQNTLRYSWKFEKVDDRLRNIMHSIVHASLEAAARLLCYLCIFAGIFLARYGGMWYDICNIAAVIHPAWEANMAKSMTGFGRAQEILHQREITVEVKSVNSRYFEYYSRLPRSMSFLDEQLKKTVSHRVSRGKVELYLGVQTMDGGELQISANLAVARGYYEAMAEIARDLRLENDMGISDFVRLSEVFNLRRNELDEDELSNDVLQVANAALDRFERMREVEGEQLVADVYGRLNAIEEMVGEVEQDSAGRVQRYTQRLAERLKEVLADNTIDESRMLTEAAIFADKTAVEEETVRLRSHISQYRDILRCDGGMGRKLDFLTQELNREANTIGSKCQEVDITRLVVNIKAEIEKIREQIQNLE